ncbi:hypothetical protein [Cyclobacterium jeungdonense]|uniref:Outer membrane protein beta-barrel domain-containing protein n=1 Tax=Cyclobacterium jeungdonense TaxID=708087 RepID=A0ABT8C1G9_9BACT|nr:hypothetical protein [Cyclobacterium jeungdonense]MDN3686634.1 hypothetical protein [Cyclobacterium jeungdonense]
MKHLFIALFMLLGFRGFAQEYEVGLRLGEPYGITFKTPIHQNYSAEVVIGRGSSNTIQYYRRSFENNRPVSSALYDGQQVSGAFSAQVRMAYEESLNGEFDITEGNLIGYAGAGAQLRSVSVTYFYHTPNSGEGAADFRESRSNVDIGPEGFIGSAYYFETLPLGVFAELGLFMEVLDRFGHLKVQGAIGGRYVFGK